LVSASRGFTGVLPGLAAVHAFDDAEVTTLPTGIATATATNLNANLLAPPPAIATPSS
jgi:hypothetical protein